MSMSDPIADLLTRIRNASRAEHEKVDKARGMNVSVVTSAKTDEEARKLLQFIGMPFRQN